MVLYPIHCQNLGRKPLQEPPQIHTLIYCCQVPRNVLRALIKSICNPSQELSQKPLQNPHAIRLKNSHTSHCKNHLGFLLSNWCKYLCRSCSDNHCQCLRPIRRNIHPKHHHKSLPRAQYSVCLMNHNCPRSCRSCNRHQQSLFLIICKSHSKNHHKIPHRFPHSVH